MKKALKIILERIISKLTMKFVKILYIRSNTMVYYYYVTLEVLRKFFVFFCTRRKAFFPVEADTKIRPDWGFK